MVKKGPGWAMERQGDDKQERVSMNDELHTYSPWVKVGGLITRFT